MVDIPWPVTNAPGAESQEGGGKLINVFVERRGDEQGIVWRRSPGCIVFIVDPSAGSAAGSAAGMGFTLVKIRDGSAAGSATAMAVGDTLYVLSGAGQAAGNSIATGDRLALIEADGAAAGRAVAEAVGST
jgi:hypothetical protein